MPDLYFGVEGAEPVTSAAAPTLSFKVLVTNPPADSYLARHHG